MTKSTISRRLALAAGTAVIASAAAPALAAESELMRLGRQLCTEMETVHTLGRRANGLHEGLLVAIRKRAREVMPKHPRESTAALAVDVSRAVKANTREGRAYSEAYDQANDASQKAYETCRRIFAVAPRTVAEMGVVTLAAHFVSTPGFDPDSGMVEMEWLHVMQVALRGSGLPVPAAIRQQYAEVDPAGIAP